MTAAKKKDFTMIDNPAMTYISNPAEAVNIPDETSFIDEVNPVAAVAATPEGYKVDPKYIEKKTKRVQLLIQPSLLKALEEVAKETGISRNELFSKAVECYLQQYKNKK